MKRGYDTLMETDSPMQCPRYASFLSPRVKRYKPFDYKPEQNGENMAVDSRGFDNQRQESRQSMKRGREFVSYKDFDADRAIEGHVMQKRLREDPHQRTYNYDEVKEIIKESVNNREVELREEFEHILKQRIEEQYRILRAYAQELEAKYTVQNQESMCSYIN